MDDQETYTTFLTEVVGIAIPRVLTELQTFANTFRALLASTEEELNSFIKNTHSSNSARAIAAKILIPAGVVINLQSVLFELKDRERCGALPNLEMLSSIDVLQLTVMREQRALAIHDSIQDRLATLPEMAIPKLTDSNYDAFNTAFVALTARTMGVSGTTLDYLTRTENGNFDSVWDSRRTKLKSCTMLTGPRFKRDSEALYSLYVQHVGTEGHGSNIVKQFKTTKNGYRCYHAFEAHFKNDAYLDNKATKADQAIQNATYRGDRRTFTLETYYGIMSNAFNDLSQSGPAHALNEQQKITKFENGLKDSTAISWAITAKNHWNSLPVGLQTFDAFYNEFSKYMTKFKTMSTPDTRNARIANLGTAPGNDGGRGRGRGGRGRGRGRFGGRGFGRGRGRHGRGGRGRGFNPYSMSRDYTNGNFTPAAKIYNHDEWYNLSIQQKQQVVDLKIQQGWINGQTPPHGFVLNNNGHAVPSTRLVSQVQQSLSGNQSQGQSMVQLPPPPPPGRAPTVPPVIDTNASQAGASFGRRGTRQNNNDNNSVSNISMVSINGQSYNGAVFDSNGNRLG
jgi:hypothetical protein